VGPTPYYVEIFNSSTGSIEAWCGFGVTCATVVAQSGSTVQNYVAYISVFGTASPPPSIQATSSTQVVSWLTVTLEATGQFLAPGQAVTLTATASLDVGPTPFWIEIVDVEGATSPIICGFGTTCSASVTHSGAFSNFAAYVSRFGTTDPPPDVRSEACCIDVTWMSVGLTASPQALTAGETTTLAATANMDVGPTPFSILIYGASSSAPVAVCAYGTTCEVAVTQPSPVIDVYVAVIAPVAHTIPTYPPPGVRATSDPVDVSWNPPPAPIAVPYVIGDTSTADAASTLQAAGLVLGTVGNDINCDSIGMVDREDPPAGTQVLPGSAVSIYFGVPPAPPQECP